MRRDLLFAGTELGVFISWNGGKDWSPFQLNLPVTPITDLRVHKGNLIAATSGRSFWILDDLALIRQYQKDTPAFSIYKPANAYLVNGGSELKRLETPEFTGANTFRGVNPANGIVALLQSAGTEEGRRHHARDHRCGGQDRPHLFVEGRPDLQEMGRRPEARIRCCRRPRA